MSAAQPGHFMRFARYRSRRSDASSSFGGDGRQPSDDQEEDAEDDPGDEKPAHVVGESNGDARVRATITPVLSRPRRLPRNRFAPFLHPNVLPWLLLAVVLVVLRCAPSLWFEPFDFDSDQAVVGLMAKHLVEGRTFPLLFYGQNYMLGVQAWMAAPFFLVGGPTIAMLKLPLLLVNLAVAVWLFGRLVGRKVAPGLALVATLPFLAPGLLASKLLMQALGASVEPFLYVLLLWAVRRRPVAFGAIFAFSYLHREFVLFALPALAIVWLLEQRTADRQAVAFAAKATGAFATVWLAIDQLARHVNTLGPPGGEYSPGSLVAQSQMVVARVAWNAPAYVARLTALVQTTLPDLFAARTVPAWLVGVRSPMTIGSTVGGAALAVAATTAAIVIVSRLGRSQEAPDRFHLYLGLVAAQTVLAYSLNGGLDPQLPGVARYVLLALFAPLALVGAALERRPGPAWTAAIALPIVLWASLNVADNVRLAREYVTSPPPNDARVLADYLVAHRIRYGRAEYWDAYLVDFLSRERVILAPTRVTRISAYDARVERNAPNAVAIIPAPCNVGTRVRTWCIDDPLKR